MKVIFTSDIHGNEIQYKKLVDFVVKEKPDFVIIGGDIAPKKFYQENFIEGQRSFFKNKLPELLNPIKKELPNCKIFLMMGNDDAMSNMDVLEENDGKLFYLIHNKRLKLSDELDLVGYGYVPITPFGIKDWEKYDFSNTPEKFKYDYEIRKLSNYRLNAKKSSSEGWVPFEFTPKIEKENSIQKDLESEVFVKNTNRTIYVIHCPPNGTSLDMVLSYEAGKKSHVGSFAVRDFIEKYQPFLTLHGHIHETVDVSGKYQDKIGETLCMSSGNHNTGDNLMLLIFNTQNPSEAKRLKI
ncbi:metallophosphoesterase [Patescibacteria group bacterium]